jgi:hypothetical protein
VLVFVFVELCSALYSVLVTWIQWRFGVDVCMVAPYLCILDPYLMGADWCCSSIAIYNLLVIEIRFHDIDTMKRFGPRLKFFAIKIMVLVSFWSALVLPIVQAVLGVTAEQVQLLDASFRIYTMAFVAVLNVFAWWPFKDWFNIVSQSVQTLRKMAAESGAKKLTDVGVRERPTTGILSLVKELLPDADAEDFGDVRITVKEMEEDTLDLLMYRGSQIGFIVESSVAAAKRETVPRWRMLGPKNSSDSATQKVLLMNRSLEEKQTALLDHLASFYPVDTPGISESALHAET